MGRHPVGGADKVSTFVSLLGANKLNIAALIDANPRDQQRIKSLQQNGHLGDHSLIQVSEFVSGSEADLEDLLILVLLQAGLRAYAGDLPEGGLRSPTSRRRPLASPPASSSTSRTTTSPTDGLTTTNRRRTS